MISGALVASIRHRASSIIEVVRIHISGRAYLLFLAFVWLALVYIVVAFTDMTATMFVGCDWIWRPGKTVLFRRRGGRRCDSHKMLILNPAACGDVRRCCIWRCH
jgi:hypothetical protein